MAKYGRKAAAKIGEVMEEFREGKLESGRSGKKVTERKQAIAIGLSEARAAGDKVPPRKTAGKKAALTKALGSRADAKKSVSTKKARKKTTKSKPAATRSAGKKMARKKAVHKMRAHTR